MASSRIPAAGPVAIIFTSVPGPEPIETSERKRIRAALVTSRPVRPMPCTTAVSVEPVRSYCSRIRLRMNTSWSIESPNRKAKIISGIQDGIEPVAWMSRIASGLSCAAVSVRSLGVGGNAPGRLRSGRIGPPGCG